MNGFGLTPENSRKLVAVIRNIATNPMNAQFHAVRQIVTARGIEPRDGFVANELAVTLGNGVEVSIEGRKRGHGVAIARWHGAIVLHQCDSMGHATYLPGDWEDEVAAALAGINGDLQREIEHNRAMQSGGFVVGKIAA